LLFGVTSLAGLAWGIYLFPFFLTILAGSLLNEANAEQPHLSQKQKDAQKMVHHPTTLLTIRSKMKCKSNNYKLHLRSSGSF
jgi:hypothetical protein